MKNDEEYSLPQKIHFKLTGGLNDEYPLDLRASAEFLIYFQHIIDKSYCVISGKERLSSKEKQDYQIRIKNLQVGSLVSDLILIIKGVSLALPLAGFANPKTIWDYACYSLEFYKRCAEARKNELPISTKIETHGDNSPINLNLIINGESNLYPPEVLEIAKRSVPVYRKLAQAMDRGKFDAFSAQGVNSPLNFNIDSTQTKLFQGDNLIQDDTKKFVVDIIDFNKETMAGRLRILSNELMGSEYPFSILGNQSPNKYIVGMGQSRVTISALTEVSHDNLEAKIIRIHIINIVAA